MKEEDFESPEFRKFLDLCVNCKACLQQCPSGIDTSKLMVAARSRYVKLRGLRKTELILSHNRYLSKLSSTFASVSNYFMGLPVTKWLLENLAGLDKNRSMPKFSQSSFLKAAKEYLATSEPIAEPIDKVAYFVDTYANYNDHELGFAVIDVLRANSVEVILPKQLPTPLPSIVYGDVKTAKDDLAYSVKHLAKAVRDGYKIICSEPSAALCLKQELRHYVGGPDAQAVTENTFELMDYLYGLYSENKLKKPTKSITEEFVYHLPCHLCAAGLEGASIKLLQEHCGIKVTDLTAGCCGIAGTFGMQKKNSELSSKISESLKNALEKSPTKNVLTECAACKMQIEHISDCTARHPIKVLADAFST
jgi:Fe-S oxidoreductase